MEGLQWELQLKEGFVFQDAEIMTYLHAHGHDPLARAKE